MREAKRRYWDEDLRHFGEPFVDNKGGWVFQEPARSTEDEYFSTLEDANSDDLTPELFLAIQRLTPKQRFAIQCRYGMRSEGRQMNVEEIAEVMSISHPAVVKLIKKGLRNLEREVQHLRGVTENGN